MIIIYYVVLWYSYSIKCSIIILHYNRAYSGCVYTYVHGKYIVLLLHCRSTTECTLAKSRMRVLECVATDTCTYHIYMEVGRKKERGSERAETEKDGEGNNKTGRH